MLYCASFESCIRQNFGFFPLLTRIVCCLANARQQQEGDVRICGDADLRSFWCGIAVSFILTLGGIAVQNTKRFARSFQPLGRGFR